MILVTGGTGLIGTALLQQLAAKGRAVRVFSRQATAPAHLKSLSNLQWIQGDIEDFQALEDALEGVDEVYHAAGLVSFDAKDRERIMRINVMGTENVVNACLYKGVRKLVHVSSVAALGKALEGKAIDEKTEWEDSKNNSVYALSKMLAEREVWRGLEEGLQVAIVNPTIVIGYAENDPWQSSSSFFPMIKKGLKFYTNGVNGFVGADDVAALMIQLMESAINGERYVLTAGNHSYREVFTWIATALNVPAPTIEVKPWMGALAWRFFAIAKYFGVNPLVTKETTRSSLMSSIYDNSKVKRELNFTFTPIKELVEEIVKRNKL
jgi:nucleoside-diphosphate-sugar epimerase